MTWEGVAFVSALYTATQSTPAIGNAGGRYLTVYVDATVDAESASVTPSMEGWDRASGKWYTVWTGAAGADVVSRSYALGPGLLATAVGGHTETAPDAWAARVVRSSPGPLSRRSVCSSPGPPAPTEAPTLASSVS